MLLPEGAGGRPPINNLRILGGSTVFTDTIDFKLINWDANTPSHPPPLQHRACYAADLFIKKIYTAKNAQLVRGYYYYYYYYYYLHLF